LHALGQSDQERAAELEGSVLSRGARSSGRVSVGYLGTDFRNRITDDCRQRFHTACIGGRAMTAAQLGVAAVDRALLILSALASAPEPSSLAQLARATGLYKSTMLRIIASLEAAGY